MSPVDPDLRAVPAAMLTEYGVQARRGASVVALRRRGVGEGMKYERPSRVESWQARLRGREHVQALDGMRVLHRLGVARNNPNT
jgi:hypothetical protein